jgi:hypothetical protein
MGDDLLAEAVVIVVRMCLVTVGRIVVALLIELYYLTSRIEAFISSF